MARGLLIVGLDFMVRPMTFKDLLGQTGMSARGASRLLGVPYERVRNWIYGRTQCPDDVMVKMSAYAAVAKKIFG